jgi:arylsulfatase A-like enzyme
LIYLRVYWRQALGLLAAALAGAVIAVGVMSATAEDSDPPPPPNITEVSADPEPSERPEKERGHRKAKKAEKPDPELERPNVVVLLADDQPDDTFTPAMMPDSFSQIAGQGVNFSGAIAAPPLCCPFRAGLLSGRYAHNNGVDRNRPGYELLDDPELVLPNFFREAGYTTSFVGKYLNGTTKVLDAAPAPGWDRWYQLQSLAYQGATISDDGALVDLPAGRSTTDALSAEAKAFIARNAGKDKPPFFLTVAYYAPHPNRVGRGQCAGNNTAKATRADFEFASQFRLPRRTSFGERDVSDKPGWVSELPRLGHADRLEVQRRWRCAIGATQPVDEGAADIIERLENTGELDNTWIVYGSDNGFNYGEHRLIGKRGFYEQMLQVPLAFRPPTGDERFAAARGITRTELVSEVDASRTLMDIAGAEPCVEGIGCSRLDGRSLLRLMLPEGSDWPRDRAIPLRLADCRLRGLRTPRYVVIQTRYTTNDGGCKSSFIELYDLSADPEQLHNIAAKRTALTEKLLERLRRAEQCSGVKGVTRRPPTGVWCE